MRKLLLLILLSFYAACGSQINDQNSVQLELENAVGNKFDGIIVYRERTNTAITIKFGLSEQHSYFVGRVLAESDKSVYYG